MKRLFTFLFILITAQLASARVLTVSNYYNSPGEYNDIPAAITAASNGDTIYVHASNVNYSAITINKQLTIYGAGYSGSGYEISGLNVYVPSVTFGNNGITTRADGSKVAGIKTSVFSVSGNDTLRNITIERCLVQNAIFTPSMNSSTDWIIRNNILGTSGAYGNIIALNSDNNIVENNIIYTQAEPPITSSSNISGNIITNNIILSSVSNINISSVVNSNFTNNIFYNLNNGSNTISIGTGNAFNDNITYNTAGTLPGAGNSGSGNLLQTDPKFVIDPTIGVYPSADSVASKTSYNWHLTSSSPGHNYGTDGSDIGIFGGPFPQQNLYGETVLPQIIKMDILNSSLPVNGTLNVNVTGVKKN